MGCTRNAPGRCRAPLGQQAAGCFLFVFLLGLLSLNVKPNFLIHRPVQPVAAARANRLVTTYGKLPLSFEPNQGQADKAVKFLARGRGYGLFLTPNEQSSAELVFGLRLVHDESRKSRGPTNQVRATHFFSNPLGSNTPC